MPITSSAKKAMRQGAKRDAVNKKKRAAFKEAIKKYRKAAASKTPEDAKKLLPSLYQIIDKTAKSNVIKKNTARRLKSRLSKLVK